MTEASTTIRGVIMPEIDPGDRMMLLGKAALPEGPVCGIVISNDLMRDLYATRTKFGIEALPTTFAGLSFIVDGALDQGCFEIIRSEDVWRERRIHCLGRIGLAPEPVRTPHALDTSTRPPALEDGDMRMLGAMDGYAHALVDIRWQIGYIGHWPIHPRHKRKIAARAARLRPLLELEAKFLKAHTDCRAAYEKSREPKPVPDYRHYYMAHKKFPWICSHCGYAEHETLKHFQKGETAKSSVSA